MKINVIGSPKTIKEIDIVKLPTIYAKESMVYFTSEPKNLICTDPYKEIERIKDEYERKMQHRLKGLNYWKNRALKGYSND